MNSAPPEFEKLDNFRDFGGYPVAGGRRIRRGRLFRSAQHSRMTDQDLARLAALNLAAVIDLRPPGTMSSTVTDRCAI
jgi:protein tyrosine/serine phosphatase